jgi:transcription antitermination factor NusG
MEHWYALQIRPQREQAVLEALIFRGILTFWPSYREKRGQRFIRRSLFPGYVFCRLDLDSRDHLVVSVPNVIRIVGTEKQPTPIPDHEIEAVRLVSNAPSARPERLGPDVKVGETVTVKRGPLKGIEGQVVYLKNATRILVSVELLGQSTSAEVDVDAVEPLRREAA